MNLTIDISDVISECKQDSGRYQDALESLCEEIVDEFNDMYIEKIEERDILEFVHLDIIDFASGGKIDTRAHYVRGIGDIYLVYRERTLCGMIDNTKTERHIKELCDIVLGAEKN